MSVIVDLFYPVWKEATHKPSKVSAAKGFFPQCWYYRYKLLRWIFLFHVMAGRNYFYKSLSLLWGFFNHYVVAFFEASILKESEFSVISTVTIHCYYQSSNKNCRILYFFNFFLTNFILWLCIHAKSIVSGGRHQYPKVITRQSKQLSFHPYFYLTSRQRQNITNNTL